MASRKLLKLYCPYLNRSNSAEIRLSFSINLFFQVQAAQVSSLMMPAPSPPQVPQKYWDELSQPLSPKGEEKHFKSFWYLPHDALVQQNIKKFELMTS